MPVNGHRRRYNGDYVILAVDLPDNPKIAELSDSAFRVYVEALCYARRNLTDGKLTKAQLDRIAGRRTRAAAEMRRLGLLDEDETGTYLIHDYLFYQRSAEEIAQIKQQMSDLGKKGAEKRWG